MSLKLIKMCFIEDENGKQLIPLETMKSIYSEETYQAVCNLSEGETLEVDHEYLNRHKVSVVDGGIEISDTRLLNPVRVYLKFSRYVTSNNICLDLHTIEEDEPWLTATVNMECLADGYIFVKDYSENQGILQVLIDHKIVHVIKRDICRLRDNVWEVASKHLTLLSAA